MEPHRPNKRKPYMMPDDFDDFCIYLGLEEIPPTEINLTPSLLQTGSVISIASGN